MSNKTKFQGFSLKVMNIFDQTLLAFEGLTSVIFQIRVTVALREVSQCGFYQYMILHDESRRLLVWSDMNALGQQDLTIQCSTFQSSMSYIIWRRFRIPTLFFVEDLMFADFPGVGGGWQVFIP